MNCVKSNELWGKYFHTNTGRYVLYADDIKRLASARTFLDWSALGKVWCHPARPIMDTLIVLFYLFPAYAGARSTHVRQFLD